MPKKKKKIKLISWNVNGLRAVIKKNFFTSFHQLDADIFAIQETKIQENQLTDEMKNIGGYVSFWSHATVKKGYSGVGAYSRIKPTRVNTALDVSRFDEEGRIIELDFDDFIFFNVYFPNGQMSDERLQYKLDFYE
ncbi:MAG: exodeoxyribonuclease III, partial [Desulfobacterales bacterium]